MEPEHLGLWERRELVTQTPDAQGEDTVGSNYCLLEKGDSRGLNTGCRGKWGLGPDFRLLK